MRTHSFTSFIIGILCFVFFLQMFAPVIFTIFMIWAAVKIGTYIAKSLKASEKAAQLESEEKISVEEERVKAEESGIYDQLINTISNTLCTGRIVQSPHLVESLKNCQVYLLKLKETNYEGHKRILEDIDLALNNYRKFVCKEIRTEEIESVIIKLEDSIPNIEYALKQMYLDSIHEELMDVDVQVDVLNKQLKADGLGRSDFDIEN